MSARLTAEAAQAAVDAATAVAAARGLSITVVVLDDAAVPTRLSRMNGARALSVDLATRKAETAAFTGRATHEWAGMLRDDEDLARSALASMPGLVLFGGGVPVHRFDAVIGAIGVSGAAQDEDQQLAELAVAALLRQFTQEEESDDD